MPSVWPILAASLLSFHGILRVASIELCCARKDVGGLRYTLLEADPVALKLNCQTACVYVRDGEPDKKYCFGKGNKTSRCLSGDSSPTPNNGIDSSPSGRGWTGWTGGFGVHLRTPAANSAQGSGSGFWSEIGSGAGFDFGSGASPSIGFGLDSGIGSDSGSGAASGSTCNSSMPQKDRIFLTLGCWSEGWAELCSGELYPASEGEASCKPLCAFCPSVPFCPCCSPLWPSLRSDPCRNGHVTFLTESGLLAVCGGGNKQSSPGDPCKEESFDSTTPPCDVSCRVLGNDIEDRYGHRGRIWGRDLEVPNLPLGRSGASVLTIPGHGTYILGGGGDGQFSSSLLLPGATSWVAGPSLPGSGEPHRYCTVLLPSNISFLVIGGGAVREYRLDSGDWAPEDMWPKLEQERFSGHACSVLSNTVVLTGGRDNGNNFLSATDIIDIQKKTITTGRPLNFARASFAMATLGNRVFVLGGENGTEVMDSVEEWTEQTQAWRMTGKLETRRKLASALVVSIPSLCKV